MSESHEWRGRGATKRPQHPVGSWEEATQGFVNQMDRLRAERDEALALLDQAREKLGPCAAKHAEGEDCIVDAINRLLERTGR